VFVDREGEVSAICKRQNATAKPLDHVLDQSTSTRTNSHSSMSLAEVGFSGKRIVWNSARPPTHSSRDHKLKGKVCCVVRRDTRVLPFLVLGICKSVSPEVKRRFTELTSFLVQR
jgi:hypothetical protein